MHAYYPALKPYKKHSIKVDSTHVLYLEESGDPQGLPVVVLHDGPGAGCDPHLRRFFDPQVYRIILFDQRGCGRSTPHAALDNNNTQALISDLEKIREFLGIERWCLFGGSWGATLALVYAQAHSEAVLGMILRGTFLGRVQDLKWFYEKGASHIFPDHWEDFIEPVKDQPAKYLQAYFERLTGHDELARLSAAKAFATWEARCATLQPHPSFVDAFTEPARAVSLATLSCHYFLNHCFLEDNQILENMHKIQNIPCILVHGRYDMVCPLDATWELHHTWPSSDLYIVRDAGHTANEPGTIDALILATKKIAKHYARNT